MASRLRKVLPKFETKLETLSPARGSTGRNILTDGSLLPVFGRNASLSVKGPGVRPGRSIGGVYRDARPLLVRTRIQQWLRIP